MLKALCFMCVLVAASAQIEGSGELIEGSGELEGSGDTDVSATTPEPRDRSGCPSLLDIVFLLDSSGSQKSTFETNVKWVQAIIEALPVERDQVRVAAIQYAGAPFTEFALNTYPIGENVIDHMRHVSFRSGVTHTGAALARAKIELFRPNRGGRDNAHKIVVVFTDGLSSDDPTNAAKALRELGVELYAAAVHDDAYMPEIEALVDSESDRVYAADKLTAFVNALSARAESAKVCAWDSPRLQGNADAFDNLVLDSAEVLAQYDATNDRGDLREVYDEAAWRAQHAAGDEDTVAIVDADEETIAPVRIETTVAPTTDAPTTRRQFVGRACAVDLLVMLDGSGSVQHEYSVQKNFVERLLDGLKMPEQRAAVIQFAGARLQKTEFGFDDYKTHAEVMRALKRKVRHFTGTTHLGAALAHARKVLDKRRTNAKSILVLVSDGYTQDDVVAPVQALKRQFRDLEIYAVGLADLNNQRVLEAVTGGAERVFIGAQEAARLESRLDSSLHC